MTLKKPRRPLRIAGAAAVCLGLAACGSQVPPQQFVNAQGAYAGNGGNGTGTANGTGSGGTGNGDVPAGTGTTNAGSGGTGAGSGKVGTGNGGTGTGNGSTGKGSGNTGTGQAGTGSGSSGGGSHGASSGVKAGSCTGFKNGTGITNSTITIANAADLSGPVPGLFKSASAAVTAYVAYFNATSSICGRKLKVEGLDSGTSESGDQQAATTACGNAFAMVGSMGAFDAGGADTVTSCGIPDLRTASTETARYKSPVAFGAYSLAVPEIPVSPFTYFKSLGNQYKDAAFVYLSAGASTLNAKSFVAGETKQGYDFKDQIAIDPTSVPNYPGYVTQLKSDNIKYVQYIGAYQYAQKLKAEMARQNYNPIFVMDPTAYDANYVSAGSAMNGTYVFVAGPLFEEANRNPELSN
jgi:ABC-type branched-subunit amino acid transport system substrate-binding protein